MHAMSPSATIKLDPTRELQVVEAHDIEPRAPSHFYPVCALVFSCMEKKQ